jgi:hypothetical protein
MHLTTAETSLASVLVGGVIGVLGGSLQAWRSEHRDHVTRLWEKEVELYESVLLEVNASESLYRDLRMRYRDWIPGWELQFPKLSLDRMTENRIRIQLAMFGRPSVQEAHEECTRLLKECVIAMGRLASLTTDQEEPTELDRDKVKRYLEDLLKIVDAADEAQDHLTRVVRDSVTRIPAARRGRFLFTRRREIMLPTSFVKSDFWTESQAETDEDNR